MKLVGSRGYICDAARLRESQRIREGIRNRCGLVRAVNYERFASAAEFGVRPLIRSRCGYATVRALPLGQAFCLMCVRARCPGCARLRLRLHFAEVP